MKKPIPHLNLSRDEEAALREHVRTDLVNELPHRASTHPVLQGKTADSPDMLTILAIANRYLSYRIGQDQGQEKLDTALMNELEQKFLLPGKQAQHFFGLLVKLVDGTIRNYSITHPALREGAQRG
jgi:hypothetical protein